MNTTHIIYIVLLSIATLYALAKEREEGGCTRPIYSVGKQCDEDSTAYLANTKPEAGDAPDVLVSKIENALSFHEKGAIWRKCILLSNAYIFVVLMFTVHMACMPVQHYVLMHLCFVAVIYFYHNYVNYHFLRRLKANGTLAARMLEAKCNTR